MNLVTKTFRVCFGDHVVEGHPPIPGELLGIKTALAQASSDLLLLHHRELKDRSISGRVVGKKFLNHSGLRGRSFRIAYFLPGAGIDFELQSQGRLRGRVGLDDLHQVKGDFTAGTRRFGALQYPDVKRTWMLRKPDLFGLHRGSFLCCTDHRFCESKPARVIPFPQSRWRCRPV